MNLEPLIPIVLFLMPVGIVFIVSHFRHKTKELEAELEMRRLAHSQTQAQLEARVDRLESVILAALQRDGAPGAPEARPVAAPAVRNPHLYEAPPLEDPLAPLPPKREPTR